MNRSMGFFPYEVLCVGLGLLLCVDVVNKSVSVMQLLYDKLSSWNLGNILFAALERSCSEYERGLKLLFKTVDYH